MTRMGNAPIRIEILTVLSGVEFDECTKAAHTVELEGIRVPMISFDHLLTNKRASGRHKDLEDVAHLERLQRRKKP